MAQSRIAQDVTRVSMSADSPIRLVPKPNGGNSVILPQQVIDPTILESVAGFINDVVPTTCNLPSDSKDQIQWARFEQVNNGEQYNFPESNCEKNYLAPLLLVLGYTTGIQIWAIPANGEAIEILSWRHGTVRVLRILPAPEKVGQNTMDIYAAKRPLIALCDNVTPGTDYCSLSFISLKTGEQVKLIKFKNPILDVISNQKSVVVTFNERIAVFDSFTLEDRLTVTTCYLSPGLFPNPVALGSRWLAYAENKLLPSRRSSGGNDGEGVQSYTATVLHAAKSLGRGLRELGETVASSLTGNVQHKPGPSLGGGNSFGQNDVQQKGIVTILDIEAGSVHNNDKCCAQTDAIVAHFTAHKEAIVCLCFDSSGLLLLTADKRGHDFHLFRIHPHPGGPALAAVHHLYVLHRGDTTARVQDMCFSPDSRWATVSTLRGTTHVFPITPYGGNVGVRTHATPHVVNKMSRFHRSAGLTAEGRSNSPISLFEAPVNSNLPYHNPRLPPYPHPTVVHPLAQIRQPLFPQNPGVQQRPNLGRQRLGSSSEDNIQVAMRLSACFAQPRAWIEPMTQAREATVMKPQVKPVESLFVMSLHGSLVQYDLDPHHALFIPKEKVCDDTLIELSVSAKAQWILQRQPGAKDVQLPMLPENVLWLYREDGSCKSSKPDHTDDRWLSQVEIVTHAGPHRRLWMGPQFTFKTYNNNTGASLNILETQSIDVVRSKPVNMPLSAAYPILIEAGSVSSCEPSPKLLDNLQRNFEEVGGTGESQLREDLADAMQEPPGSREAGGRCVIVSMKHHYTGVAKVVNPLGMVVTVQSDDESDVEPPEEVIHENCDEALFRPVVASKAVVFAEPKDVQPKLAHSVLHVNRSLPKHDGANILLSHKVTKDFINKTGTTLYKKAKELSPKRNANIMEDVNITTKGKYEAETKNYNLEDGPKTKAKGLKDMNIIDKSQRTVGKSKNDILDLNKCPRSVPDTVDDKQSELARLSKKGFKTKIVDFVEKSTKSKCKVKMLDVDASVCPPDMNSEVDAINQKEARIETLQDSFFDAKEVYEDHNTNMTSAKQCFETGSLEKSIQISKKVDVFESPFFDLNIGSGESGKPEAESKELLSSFEEQIEEKQINKKVRKPKVKLGVRIGNPSKVMDEKNEDVVRQPAMRSWSSVASGKNAAEIKSNSSPVADFVTQDSELSCPEFSFKPETLETIDILQPEKSWIDESIVCGKELMKNDKSSDDEKLDNSSQTETTESDDSSKLQPVIVMDTEEDAQLAINKPKCNIVKSKKPKKKRR